MRHEQIQELLERDPFTPFRLHLSDGSTWDITDPNAVFLTRSFMEIATPLRRGSRFMQHVQYIGLVHIVRVDFVEEESMAGRGGD